MATPLFPYPISPSAPSPSHLSFLLHALTLPPQPPIPNPFLPLLSPLKTARGLGERYSSPSRPGHHQTHFLCNLQPKICKSVKSFAHCTRRPVGSFAIKHSDISRCPNFYCNGKIMFKNVLRGTRRPLQSGLRWTLSTLPTPLLRTPLCS